MKIKTVRTYKNHHTDGVVTVNGEHFCHSLEDIGRPAHVKIAEETCIPEGTYNVIVSRSERFQKDMILLYNCDDMCVRNGEVEYSGIRAHGGNDVGDTEGCILLAFNSDKAGKIWGRASDLLCELVAEAIDRGEWVTWEVTHE